MSTRDQFLKNLIIQENFILTSLLPGCTKFSRILPPSDMGTIQQKHEANYLLLRGALYPAGSLQNPARRNTALSEHRAVKQDFLGLAATQNGK